jgi:hexosaminidase
MNARILLLLSFAITSQYIAQVLPTPVQVDKGKGQFVYTQNIKAYYSPEAIDEARLFKTILQKELEIHLDLQSINELKNLGKNQALVFNAKKTSPNDYRETDESYTLSIQQQIITLDANMDAGLWRGLQTLRQLMLQAAESHALEVQVIRDQPAFVHRGLLLDCCRHFMEVDFILKYIDLLSLYKMNVLHWHLTEDQGWRIEIDAFPKLISVGAQRITPEGSVYSGHYTKEDIRRVVKYATERHITVIPEIEMPGHSRAAIASYPYLSCTGEPLTVANDWGVFKDIYCAGNDSVFNFLEKVLDEVCTLFPSPYIHIGGDEAPKFRWDHCPKCKQRMTEEKISSSAGLQTWFINRVATYLETKGKRIIGWDEILEGGIPASATVQSWRGMEGGVHAAREGHSVIMSPTSHCYFDYGLSSTDLPEVYQFRPIPEELNESERKFVLGGECNLWSEHAPQELVDQKVFPRMLGMSEVLWRNSETRDYANFFQQVERQLSTLKMMDVDFGFSQIPVKLEFAPRKDSMIVSLIPHPESVKLEYRMSEMADDIQHEYRPYKTPIAITAPSDLQVRCTYQEKQYNEQLIWRLDPHMAYHKSLTLSYSPSPWYTGGGKDALVDGNMGSMDFRDGHWQAVQGADMSMTIDLEKDTVIRSVTTQWYMYNNAWIFVPERVELWGSDDASSWTHLDTQIIDEDIRETGQRYRTVIQSLQGAQYRFIKVNAMSRGVCPDWHEAAGEPSWLFCDEIVVR